MNKLIIKIIMGIAVGVAIYVQYQINCKLTAQLETKETEIKNITDNRDALKLELIASEESKRQLIDEVKHQQQLLADRDLSIKESQTELVRLADQLRGLRNTHDNVKTWSDARVPDAVVSLLHQTRTNRTH